MSLSEFYPYKSAQAKDSFYAYYGSLAAQTWPVASEERTIPTSFGQTFLRLTGPSTAPPLVLLPGAVTTSLMWAPNIEALSRCFRTFALDQIGDIGRTTCLRPIRSMGDLMRWLDQVFDALELYRDINLVGISYGGGLAAQYLLHGPERLSKAVLIAPAASVLPISKQFLARLTLAAVASRRFLPPLLHWMFADMARKDPAWIEATLQQLFMAMKSIDRRLPIPPVMPDAAWAALRVPTLLLVGEHETIYSATAAVTRLRRIAPQVQTQIVPGAGHDLTFAQPGIVNQAMLEFLRQPVA